MSKGDRKRHSSNRILSRRCGVVRLLSGMVHQTGNVSGTILLQRVKAPYRNDEPALQILE